MNSRMILDTYGMDKKEAINILISILPELTLEELDEVLVNVELEFVYREEHNLLGEDEDEQDRQ
jgi:hypothetical protein